MSCYSPRTCNHPGCNEPAMFNGYDYRGFETYKTRCSKHHKEHFAKKKGLTATAWTRSYHPYRGQMKDYCENVDGRLGFACTSTIFPDMGMLQVDHIDGDPSNNVDKNLQTLCACCHAYKTNKERDYATPGRKTLNVR